MSRMAKKCEKQESEPKLKVKKMIEKGDVVKEISSFSADIGVWVQDGCKAQLPADDEQCAQYRKNDGPTLIHVPMYSFDRYSSIVGPSSINRRSVQVLIQ